MGLSSSGRWGDVVGGLRDQAQVYSTVHVSPVWLGGWRRGPVGVTTEARVCEGWGRGREGVGGERGGPRGERKEQETAGEGRLFLQAWAPELWGPSTRCSLVSPLPYLTLLPGPLPLPAWGPSLRSPLICGSGMDLPEDGPFSPDPGPSLLIHSLLTYETGWSKQAPPRVHGRTRESVCCWVSKCGPWASSGECVGNVDS